MLDDPHFDVLEGVDREHPHFKLYAVTEEFFHETNENTPEYYDKAYENYRAFLKQLEDNGEIGKGLSEKLCQNEFTEFLETIQHMYYMAGLKDGIRLNDE